MSTYPFADFVGSLIYPSELAHMPMRPPSHQGQGEGPLRVSVGWIIPAHLRWA